MTVLQQQTTVCVYPWDGDHDMSGVDGLADWLTDRERGN